MTVPGSDAPNPSPKPEAAQTAPKTAVDATKYVGTPAVGTSKAAASAGLSSSGPSNTEIDQRRRRLVWVAVTAFLTAWFLAFFRFFLPRTLFEPNTVFKIGYPSEFALGVDTKFQQKYRIWVDRTPGPRIRNLRALHTSGLHSGLEAQREQIQMSLPRQRLRQRGNQLRRAGAAPNGPRTSGTRARRTDHRRYFAALPVAQGTAQQIQRSGSIPDRSLTNGSSCHQRENRFLTGLRPVRNDNSKFFGIIYG